MNIWGEQAFDVPREQVWSLIDRPDILQKCLPGCEHIESIGTDVYAIKIVIGVSMLRGTFDGRVRLYDKVEPESLWLSLEINSSQGQLSGAVKIELSDEPKTTARFNGSANISGTVARVGARIIQPTARKLVNQFTACLAASAESLPSRPDELAGG